MISLWQLLASTIGSKYSTSRKRRSAGESKLRPGIELLETRQLLSANCLGGHDSALLGASASSTATDQHQQAVSAAHHVVNFTGTWKVTTNSHPSQTFTLTLSQDGKNVSGDIDFGGTPRSVEGTVHGNRLSLTLDPTPPGTPITIVSGSLDVTLARAGHFQGKLHINGEAAQPQTLAIRGTLQNHSMGHG